MRGGGFEIDDSEVRTLARDLSGAPARIQFDARGVINKGRKMTELAMKDVAREARRSARTHIPHIANSVTSEMESPWQAVIGFSPRRGTQGFVPHILAYGSVNNAPVMDHTQALRRTTPLILRMLGEAGEDDVIAGQAR
jgi:hypothetical protein